MEEWPKLGMIFGSVTAALAGVIAFIDKRDKKIRETVHEEVDKTVYELKERHRTELDDVKSRVAVLENKISNYENRRSEAIQSFMLCLKSENLDDAKTWCQKGVLALSL